MAYWNEFERALVLAFEDTLKEKQKRGDYVVNKWIFGEVFPAMEALLKEEKGRAHFLIGQYKKVLYDLGYPNIVYRFDELHNHLVINELKKQTLEVLMGAKDNELPNFTKDMAKKFRDELDRYKKNKKFPTKKLCFAIEKLIAECSGHLTSRGFADTLTSDFLIAIFGKVCPN